MGQIAHVFGGDHIAHFVCGRVRGAFDDLERGRGIGSDQLRLGMIEADVQSFRRRRCAEHIVPCGRCCDQKAGDPVGKRGFANPARPCDQPAVV